MPETVLTREAARKIGARTGFLAGAVQRALLARLEELSWGRLTLRYEGRVRTFGSGEREAPLTAEVHVHDPRFWSAVALRGSVGAGEAYVNGWWTTPDLVAVVRLLVRNQAALEAMEGGLARLATPLLKLFHGVRRNSKDGSRANIAAHYDLSNEFFALFLDPTMTYSAGVFEHEDATMEEASVAKLDRICRKLELSPDDHLLEIGTGWGSLALHAAREYGCRVTTTTISARQHALAAERIRAAGLEDRITLLTKDYRDLDGQYDKLVSVEMIEAVGHQYYPSYFEQVGRLLAPDGMALIQAIVIADHHYERARRSVDFIQRYVFPGATIPSITALLSAAATHSDLRLYHLEDLTTNYVRTLAAWREKLFANLDQVRALGLGDEFVRLWEFYLCYCEGGFAERHIGDVQLLLTKPECRRAPLLVPREALA